MKKAGMLLGALLFGLCLATPAASTTVKLSSELLTLHQLPKGWITAAASSIAIPGRAATTFPAGSTNHVGTGFNFQVEKGFPLITELLATYKNVTTVYSSLAAGLSACTRFSGKLWGYHRPGSSAM